MRNLVLSLFPGIGLLDMAFEMEGFCVVRGPDLLWGGDVRRFHPPAGRFDGVIGGPPCQAFSRFRYLNPAAGKHGNQIPEFERVVREARPAWFVMENVPEAPEPVVADYAVTSQTINNRWLGAEQHRVRRFSFGAQAHPEPQSCRGCRHDRAGVWDSPWRHLEFAPFESNAWSHAVTGGARAVPVALVRDGKGGHKRKATASRPPTVIAGHGAPFDRDSMSVEEMCELQGLPREFATEMPFTAHGKRKVIGNGVPLPMGRAIARAVRSALGLPLVAEAENLEVETGGLSDRL